MVCSMYSTSRNNKRIAVPSDDGTRKIGEIVNHVFTKFKFNSVKHICYKHKAICLDKRAFLDYILPNADSIVCPDKKRGTTYKIDVSLFNNLAKEDDLSWGAQLFVPLAFWTKEKKDHQLSLWEAT